MTAGMSQEIQPQTQTDITPHDLLHIFFFSFAHSQGRLILQPDIFSYIASKWRQNGQELDFTIREKMAETVQMYRPPHGHRPVNAGETQAQFAFWWENMWDIFSFHGLSSSGATQPPTEKQLQERSRKFSGDAAYKSGEYESLRADKMRKIADRIADNTPELGSNGILENHLLSNLLSVEMYFQGFPKYSEIVGRQRTDGGDEFECKLLTHLQTASRKKEEGERLTVYDLMYIDISEYIEKILAKKRRTKAQKSIYNDYMKLVELYNRNHPGTEREFLHRVSFQ